jgi:hypothetical protein
MAVAESSSEKHTMIAMRSRLMAYSKGMPGSRLLRGELQQASLLSDVQNIAERHLDWLSGVESIERASVFDETAVSA